MLYFDNTGPVQWDQTAESNVNNFSNKHHTYSFKRCEYNLFSIKIRGQARKEGNHRDIERKRETTNKHGRDDFSEGDLSLFKACLKIKNTENKDENYPSVVCLEVYAAKWNIM